MVQEIRSLQKLAIFFRVSRWGRRGGGLYAVLYGNHIDLQDLAKCLLFWERDLPSASSLLSELKQWQRFWKLKSESLDNIIPADLAHCIHAADEDVFPNIRVLLIIACTIPVSSYEAERSFSALRHIKSYLRSTMSSERFAGLALMHLQSDVDIDIDEVCEAFISKHNRKMFQSCILYQ